MENVIIKFVVPIPPVTKKNHQRILKNRRTGKSFVAPSEQYDNYKNSALWFIPKRGVPIDFPVNIKCLFFLPDQRRCDLTNHLESIDDILVEAGLILDDNYKILAAHDGSRVLVDKSNPRTEIEITVLKDGGFDVKG